MPGGTMKTQNGQWGQSNYEGSKFYIIYKPMLLRETYFFFLFTLANIITIVNC